jgi:hypothetical protein
MKWKGNAAAEDFFGCAHPRFALSPSKDNRSKLKETEWLIRFFESYLQYTVPVLQDYKLNVLRYEGRRQESEAD